MHDPAKLLPVAYRAAAAVAQNRLLAEEAGERALHKLNLAVIEGSPPTYPEAWLRVVARRAAWALLRTEWARLQIGLEEDLAPANPDEGRASPGLEHVRDRVATSLTRRQREALDAAMTCNTTSDAARTCGMHPRDFRRYLGTIGRKARRVLDDANAVAT